VILLKVEPNRIYAIKKAARILLCEENGSHALSKTTSAGGAGGGGDGGGGSGFVVMTTVRYRIGLSGLLPFDIA
jgi:hypothetical protein